MSATRRKAASKAHGGRYLRRFTLQNVRTFRSPVTLDFCQPDGKVAQWTVILGENGTGKTTLLQYLAGMTPTKLGFERKYGELIGPLIAGNDWESWLLASIPIGAASNVIEAELIVSGVSQKLDSQQTSVPASESIFLNVAFAHFGGRAKGAQGGYVLKTLDRSYLDHCVVLGYGAGRHIASSASPYLASDTFFQNGGGEPSSTLFHDDYPLISPEQWLLGLDHASKGGGSVANNAKRALASARRCFERTLPGIESVSVKLHQDPKGQTSMALMCSTPYGEVPFSSLSVGYRTMAAWLTDFVKRMHQAYPEMEEPDDGPAVVLIDEFDLHMHPKWQREAMLALGKEFPNTQFIITAHSPIVVQAAQGHAKLIVLRRKQRDDGLEEVEVVDNPEVAAGWRVDQILESVYGMSPRMPEYSDLMKRRIELLQKPKLKKDEARELEEIEARLDEEAPSQDSEASKWLRDKLQEALGKAQSKGG